MRIHNLVESAKNVSVKLPTPSFIRAKHAKAISQEQWNYLAVNSLGGKLSELGLVVTAGTHDGTNFRVTFKEAALTKELAAKVNDVYGKWNESLSWDELYDVPGLVGTQVVFPIPEGTPMKAYDTALMALFGYEFPDLNIRELFVSHSTGCVITNNQAMTKDQYIATGGVLGDNLPKFGVECISRLFLIIRSKLRENVLKVVGDDKTAARISQSLMMSNMSVKDVELLASLGKPLRSYKEDLMSFGLEEYEFNVLTAYYGIDNDGNDV